MEATVIPMNLWFLDPEILGQIEIYKDSLDVYRVQSRLFQKPKKATPEEIIRQLVLLQLIYHYHYPKELIVQEYLIRMGIAKKRADIVILGEDEKINVILEIKQKINSDSIGQLNHTFMQQVPKMAGLFLFLRGYFLRMTVQEIFLK